MLNIVYLEVLCFVCLCVCNAELSSDFSELTFVSSRSSIPTADFTASHLNNISTSSRSLAECCSECLMKETCSSLMYDAGLCTLYEAFPRFPALEFFIPIPSWCDPYEGELIHFRYLDLCIKIIRQTMSCAEADVVCSQLNMTLIDVNSEWKNAFVGLAIQDAGMLGTYNAGQFLNGKWVKKNGEPFTYTNWDMAQGEPHNTGLPGECITIHSVPTYKWYDLRSTIKLGVICEKVKPRE